MAYYAHRKEARKHITTTAGRRIQVRRPRADAAARNGGRGVRRYGGAACRWSYSAIAGEPPECVCQPDGNERDVIRAFCDLHSARIEMAGENTRVVEGQLPDADRRIRVFNCLRARLGVQGPNMRLVL